MEFRILGPLEVWDGDTRVPIRGRLHPKILAGLLLNNRRTVSVEWLVDLLWDDEPPATARRQAQNVVAVVRRQLGAGREDLIRTVTGGYRLEVDDEAIDARRFEAEAGRARRMVSDQRDGEALSAFTAALGQWRGPALDGLTGRTLDAAAARLNEARLAAIEDRADVATRAGRAGQVVHELRELVAVNPLRQRLTARLMAALWQQGRSSEALRLYERLERRLKEELGIDPGPELKRLHAEVRLDGGKRRPSADAATPPQAAHPVTPAQLPADIVTFTGRHEHLAALDRLLDTGSRVGVVSTITGIGGVGKTALTIHWGHSRKDAFPDGQLYLNLRGFDEREPLSPYEAVSQLLRSLDSSTTDLPDSLDEVTARYRSIMAERRMLILLDNVRSPEQVRPLLPGGSGCLVLVTSRNRLSSLLALDHAHPITLDILSPDESFDLLTNLIGPKALRDEAGTRSIADHCAHLPLALRIAAASFVQNPDQSIATFASELADTSRLRKLRLGDDPYANVAAVFRHSHMTLGPDARTLFAHAALIPGEEFSRGLAAAVTAMPESRLNAAVNSLMQAHLFEQRASHRFGFHDLIRLYANEHAATDISDSDRALAVNRMIDWYAELEGDAGLPELDNLIAAFHAHEQHPRVAKLAMAMRSFLYHGGHIGTIRRYIETALRHAERRNDRDDQVGLLCALGSSYSAEGDSTTAIAHYRQATAMLPRIDDIGLIGTTQGNFGLALYRASEYDEAERRLLESKRIAEQTGNRRHLRTRTANLGRVYRAQGRFEAAEHHLRQAVSITDELNDTQTNAARISLGKLYVDMGRLDLAAIEARRMLATSQGAATSRITTTALLLLGEIACLRADLSEAVDNLGRAVELAARDGRFGDELEANCLLAEAHAEAGDDAGARRFLALARSLHDRAPQPAIEAELCRAAAKIHVAADRFEAARDNGEQAVALFRGLDAPLRTARSLDHLADAHHGLGDTAAAHTAWTEAHAIFTRLNVPEAERVAAKLRDHARPPAR